MSGAPRCSGCAAVVIPKPARDITSMAQPLARDLDEELVRALHSRAAEHRRSPEAEHREILKDALLKKPRHDLKAFLESMPSSGDELERDRRSTSKDRAKLIQDGTNQTVCLPSSCQFPEGSTEVLARRDGNRIILEPINGWSETFRATLGAWPEDIPRPEREPGQAKR